MNPNLSVQLAALGYSFQSAVTLPDLGPLKGLKTIPGVSWANPAGTLWFLCFYGGDVVGCCAMTYTSSGVARFKSDAVHPAHRGKGVYAALAELRNNSARDLLLGEATCYSSQDSRHQFLKDGFVVKSINSRGVAYMTKTL